MYIGPDPPRRQVAFTPVFQPRRVHENVTHGQETQRKIQFRPSGLDNAQQERGWEDVGEKVLRHGHGIRRRGYHKGCELVMGTVYPIQCPGVHGHVDEVVGNVLENDHGGYPCEAFHDGRLFIFLRHRGESERGARAAGSSQFTTSCILRMRQTHTHAFYITYSRAATNTPVPSTNMFHRVVPMAHRCKAFPPGCSHSASTVR